MERVAYNLFLEGAGEGAIKAILRERYCIGNARWIQAAMNQGRAVMSSQGASMKYRVEMYEEKVRNTRESMNKLSKPLEIRGCEAKVTKLQSRIDELRSQITRKSYPRAVFGSRNFLHRLSIANGKRRNELREEWKERRSNHFFSVGEASHRGNANTRLLHNNADNRFYLEVRNWHDKDFRIELRVPEHWSGAVKSIIGKAGSVKLGSRGELLEGGLPYSIRIVRSAFGYQVLASFELEEPLIEWSGRMAGIDVNPEGIACTIVSRDGNLIATRFYRDNRLITASRNKRKWVLENLVNGMLRWARDTHGCNAVAVERLKLKGAFDSSPKTNFKRSNFMTRKMVETVKLHSLRMCLVNIEVNPAYTSIVAITKYGKQFGGFNRHQLAAFVIARRALGHGEAPVLSCLPKTRKEGRMWNYCIRYYGYQPQIQTLLHHEPVEWKSDGDGNGGGVITKLLRAPPAITSSQMGSSHSLQGVTAIPGTNERAGRVHPNRHASGGGGARGYRVSPPDVEGRQSAVIICDEEDNAVANSTSGSLQILLSPSGHPPESVPSRRACPPTP